MKKNKTYKKLVHSFFENNHLAFIFGTLFTMISGLSMMVISYILGSVIDAAAALDKDRLIYLIIFSSISCFLLIVNDLLKCRIRASFYKKATTRYCQVAFDGIMAKSIRAFSKENSGSYISMLTNDTKTIQESYLFNIFEFGNQIVMFVGAIVMMLIYSPILTIVAIGLALLPITIAISMSKGLAKREKKVSDKNEGFVKIIKDMLSGFSVIKSFQSEKQVESQFAKENHALEQSKFNRRWWTDLLVNFTELGSIILQLGVFFVGAFLALKGQITSGTILIFVNLCNCFITPIQNIPRYISELGAAKVLIRKMASVLDENQERQGTEVLEHFSNEIVFHQVNFSYDEEKQVLQNISLKIEQGKKYAIVGNSGSGKSTLLQLLMGAFDNYEGSITFDGKELKDITSKSIYDLMSLIGQNVFLFDDTIYKNVTMFSSYKEEQIESAIQQAGLAELIEQKGIDYKCGENGNNLSGGEKQRVSIARCLLRNTPILLLDEATAALDNQTSFEIVNAILHLSDLTRIVVTHRLEKEILKQYDQIFVLWNGMIVESGTFDELMNEKGRFYSLYTLSE